MNGSGYSYIKYEKEGDGGENCRSENYELSTDFQSLN